MLARIANQCWARSKVNAQYENKGPLFAGLRRKKEKKKHNSLLALVDLDVPLAPDFGRSKHTARSTHVTKGSLTGTVSTTTRDTRNTSDSTTYM